MLGTRQFIALFAVTSAGLELNGLREKSFLKHMILFLYLYFLPKPRYYLVSAMMEFGLDNTLVTLRYTISAYGYG